MKILISLTLILSLMTKSLMGQQAEVPYYEIPEYPKEYTEFTVAARFVDGLGFRYYWATEGLTEENLSYRPAEDIRSIQETLEHIYGLSKTIVNAPQSKMNAFEQEDLSWTEMRKRTLENIAKASQLLKAGEEGDMEQYKVLFGRGGDVTEYPFWNMMNGPIEDAVYHTGQIVAFRRAAGNPIPSGVRMLTGKKTK